LYPHYPKPDTKKLILTESIIDGASLLQIEAITKEYTVLACYGTNGLNEEIQQAIKELKHLEEIIFFFDNDSAGRTATAKYGKLLQEKICHPERSRGTKLKLTTAIPINKDINETLQGHDESIFTQLLNNRTALNFSFSIENKKEE